MTQPKLFAPKYETNDEGFLLFPNDVALRRQLFKNKVQHPAHNNLYMWDAIAEYYCPEGGTIIDPMAGAGSSMWLARHEHVAKVILIELGEYYSEMLLKNKEFFEGLILIMPETDCIAQLKHWEDKEIGDLIIFSPPYADQLQVGQGHVIYDDEKSGIGNQTIEYYAYKHKMNLGNMKQFAFNRQMNLFYQYAFRALKPGGKIALVIKDRINKGQRIGYGVQHIKFATKAGFTLGDWHRREAIGQVFGHFNKSRGIRQIEDEHIILLDKE